MLMSIGSFLLLLRAACGRLGGRPALPSSRQPETPTANPQASPPKPQNPKAFSPKPSSPFVLLLKVHFQEQRQSTLPTAQGLFNLEARSQVFGVDIQAQNPHKRKFCDLHIAPHLCVRVLRQGKGRELGVFGSVHRGFEFRGLPNRDPGEKRFAGLFGVFQQDVTQSCSPKCPAVWNLARHVSATPRAHHVLQDSSP